MKVRIISAIVLLAIAVPIFIYGGLPYATLVLLCALLGTKELLDVRELNKKFPIFIKIITYLLVTLIIVANYYFSGFNNFISYKYLCGFFLIYLVPLVFINNQEKYNINDAFFAMSVVFFLGLSMGLFIQIRSVDLSHIFYLFLITITTDTFALLVGKLIGKHKLCEKISPNKTVEGFIGGTLIGTIIPAMFYVTVINTGVNVFLITGITFALSILGQLGDLVFSSIKRYYGVKDFSKLIPGHGGILDRLDSIIFVMLAYIILMGLI